jgi:peptide deformylase
MKIVNYPHPALRHPGKPLTSIDRQLQLQVGEMIQLMYEARGLALAANQVVLPYQFVVMNITGDSKQPEREEVLINPNIVERKGSVDDEEGCLSFPGLYQKVRRAKTVKVQAYDLKGRLIEKVVHDLEARVWQHETDHLQGVLYIDKMGPIARFAARGSIKEFERQYRRAQQRGEIPPDEDIEKLLTALESRDARPSPQPGVAVL